MEATFTNIVASLVCVVTIGCAWRIVDWLWLKPKRLERCLIQQGFRGNSYRFFYGDKQDKLRMVKQTTSKPMDDISNDYFHRIFPFHDQTIKTFGEACFVWEGPTPAVRITKPENIREILMKVYDFEKPRFHPLLYKLSNGLLRLEGQNWAHNRKLINPAFHMEKLKTMLPAFSECCNDMIHEWEVMSSETGSCEIEIRSFLYNMSADVISRAAFGSSFQEGRRVFELLREQIALTVRALTTVYIPGWRFLPTRMNRRASNINNEMESLLKDMIYRRQKTMGIGEDTKDDLLGILLKSSSEGIQANNKHILKLSLKQVIEECKLFYLAGQETTSALLAWTLVMLSKHKYWQNQAREEILSKFGHKKPDFDGLNELKKVNMVLHEVLRLYPPITSLLRMVKKKTRVGDIELPGGVMIEMPVLYIHHDEKLWGSNAKEFDPERFAQGIVQATRGNMSFFSFGWGPRTCIGSNFAMIETKLTLSRILQCFTFELSPSYAHAPSTATGLLHPQFGAHLIFHRI